MKDEIVRLKTLQAIDLEICALDQQLATVNSGLEKRREAISLNQEEATRLREKQQALERRRGELEIGFAEDRVKISDRQTKMMNIKTDREYQSLLKESENAKQANKDREEELLRIAEELEAITQKTKETDHLRSGEEKLLTEDRAVAAKKTAALNTGKGKMLKKRAGKAKEVAVTILKKYEILRERRHGLALVGVENGVCRGCFVNIPPQLFNDLIKEEKMLICPNCNRIMYHQAVEKEAEK
ncbi:MAG: hypothetical protein EYX74_03435 [Desulfobulbaceae bacterium]|nr:MAG: hypothetical protein EYX74_03435 [Desulfobulbaceae bacterium]